MRRAVVWGKLRIFWAETAWFLGTVCRSVLADAVLRTGRASFTAPELKPAGVSNHKTKCRGGTVCASDSQTESKNNHPRKLFYVFWSLTEKVLICGCEVPCSLHAEPRKCRLRCMIRACMAPLHISHPFPLWFYFKWEGRSTPRSIKCSFFASLCHFVNTRFLWPGALKISTALPINIVAVKGNLA